MKKKVLAGVLLAAFASLTVSFVFAKSGFDEYGYNYTAHMFIGWDQNAAKPDPVYEGTWGEAGEWWLVMKWNDAWLSKTGERPEEYYGSGAWLTNHYLSWYLGSDSQIHQFEIFGKIVAQDYEGHADEIGAEAIWGKFMLVQEVWNDPFGEFYPGVGLKALVVPPGFGYYGL